MNGTIKWFSRDKGYGYLVDPAGRERFFGRKHVQGDELPTEGSEVTFEPGKDRRDKPIARKAVIQQMAPGTGHRRSARGVPALQPQKDASGRRGSANLLHRLLGA